MLYELKNFLTFFFIYSMSQNSCSNLTDLDSSIERLFLELDSLYKECLFSANHDREIYFDQIQVRRILEDAYKYQVGSFLCSRYIYGVMNVDEFSEVMKENGLGNFLLPLCVYSPTCLA